MQNETEIQTFERLERQLHVFLREIGELSKKKPNEAVNKFKLKYINAVLADLNKLLGPGKPFPDFDVFDLDTLPSNSDVRLFLAQYVASALSHRESNTTQDSNYKWYWIIKGKISKVQTEAPSHFRPLE